MSTKYNILLIVVSIMAFQNVDIFAQEVKDIKTFSVSQNGILKLYNVDGDIDVTSWDKNEIEVEYIKSIRGRSDRRSKNELDKIEIDFEKSGKNLTITNNNYLKKTVNYSIELFGRRYSNQPRVDFKIKIPRNYNLEIVNNDGEIVISNTNGDLYVDEDDGNVYIRNVTTNNMEIVLDDGDMYIEEVKTNNLNSSVILRSDDGRIDVENSNLESLEINGDDTKIALTEVKLKNLYIILDEGNIEADIIPVGAGRISIDVDEGDVILFLPKNIQGYFDIITKDGRINTDFDLEIDRRKDDRWIRQKLGNGQLRIDVETSEGNIKLKYRY